MIASGNINDFLPVGGGTAYKLAVFDGAVFSMHQNGTAIFCGTINENAMVDFSRTAVDGTALAVGKNTIGNTWDIGIEDGTPSSNIPENALRDKHLCPGGTKDPGFVIAIKFRVGNAADSCVV